MCNDAFRQQHVHSVEKQDDMQGLPIAIIRVQDSGVVVGINTLSQHLQGPTGEISIIVTGFRSFILRCYS